MGEGLQGGFRHPDSPRAGFNGAVYWPHVVACDDRHELPRAWLVRVEQCSRVRPTERSYGTRGRRAGNCHDFLSGGTGNHWRILTDYAHWPELFDVRMRMAEIREQDGKVFTDIRIDHAMLPGERRLLSETRALPPGELLTELKGGDFKQYRRFWKLSPIDGGVHTQAEFDLLVEVDSTMPDWMIALAMRRDLESHFRLMKEKALAQSKPIQSQ